mgnify:CR=1 FL=1|tara:strand:- start:3568 stop:3945 length:378 start_codon:yes stop_codon:yes gene_type:complete
MKVDHVQWLLLEEKTGGYHSIVTRQFGGQGDVCAAVNARRGIMELTIVGMRELGPQAPTLARNVHPLPIEELDKFTVFPAHKERIDADILKREETIAQNPSEELSVSNNKEPDDDVEPVNRMRMR